MLGTRSKPRASRHGVLAVWSNYFVTVIGIAFPALPAASQAVAVMVWVPAEAFRVFQLQL